MRVYARVPGRPGARAAVEAALAAGAYGVELPVRRTAGGVLLCAGAYGAPGDPLADVLPGAPVLLDVPNLPGEPDFDAPACATAHLLVALLGAAPHATVVSADWYTLGVAREAGLRTAFRTPPGVTLDGALSYAADAGHAEVHPHASGVTDSGLAAARERGVAVVCWGGSARGVDGVVQTTTDSASGTERNVSRSTSPR